VPREIRFDDVEIAVEIVVRGGDAHASLRLAVGAERTARFHGYVGELAVLSVLIKSAGGGIVGDVDVRPAVIVEISREYTETISAVGLEDAGRFGNVCERTVTVVVIEDVFSADETGRTAGNRYAFVEARARFGNGCGGQVHVDVVGDE